MSGHAASFEVVTLPGLGRGAQAVRAFGPGDLIMRESAFALTMDGPALRLRCLGCLRPLPAEGVCCPADAVDALLTEADPDIVRVALDQRLGQRLVRMGLRLLARRLTPRAPRADAPTASAQDAFDLLAPVERHPDEVVARLEAAGRQLGIWLRRIDSTPEDFVLACARVDANAFALGGELDPGERLGMAVVPRAALFNHACTPNCGVANDGPVFTVRAMRPIEPGEALTVAYVGLYETRAVRRAELRDDHLFECLCGRCTGAVTNDDEARAVALDGVLGAHRCGACDGGAHPATPEGWGPCVACGAALDGVVASAREEALRQRLAEADLPPDRSARRALLLTLLSEAEQMLPAPHPLVFRLRWTLARTLGELGEHRERLALTRRLWTHATRALPAHSLEMAQVHHAVADAAARLMTSPRLASQERHAVQTEVRAALADWRHALATVCGLEHPATQAAYGPRGPG